MFYVLLAANYQSDMYIYFCDCSYCCLDNQNLSYLCNGLLFLLVLSLLKLVNRFCDEEQLSTSCFFLGEHDAFFLWIEKADFLATPG